MAKRTAVIDIGSNSIRVVVYEKSSRYAFYIINETKSGARISEGSYTENGYLQEVPMQRAHDALEEFLYIAKNLKCQKILCVATEALRRAPNKNNFLNRIKKKLKLDIKIIDGEKEAYLGAVAALNLLPKIDEATTIDIGGGSTELSKIKNGKIVKTASIPIGAVKLKELFFDKNIPIDQTQEYIDSLILDIYEEFCSETIVAIGGSTRALSKNLMHKDYPIKMLHAFEYEVSKKLESIKSISHSTTTELKDFAFKRDRIDTIREGILIFQRLLEKLGAKKVITSGVGVREGVYLSDILRNSAHKFPKSFNPSIKSLSDRFSISEKHENSIQKTTLKLFDALKEEHNIDEKYKKDLKIAAKLSLIGTKLNCYQNNLHGFYFLLNALNYGFTHKERVLISFLVRYQNKKLPKKNKIKEYEGLFPKQNAVNWLSFIISLSKCLNLNQENANFDISFKDQTLTIKSDKKTYLSKECIKKLSKPSPIAILISS